MTLAFTPAGAGRFGETVQRRFDALGRALGAARGSEGGVRARSLRRFRVLAPEPHQLDALARRR